MKHLQDLIQVAQGQKKATLLIKNVKLINIFNHEIQNTDIAIYKSRIAAIGKFKIEGEKEIDFHNSCYAAPGFIDSHIHIESTMVPPDEFARAAAVHGTTCVIIDPHEIANVLGYEGIKYMMEAAKHNPISIFMMLPSCVPASPLETSGSTLYATDLYPLLSDEWVLGIGEMMNYPGVITGNRDMLDKIRIAKGKRIDGHAPYLAASSLNAYVAAGIYSEHEATNLKEASEKLSLGVYIMIREGSAARNLENLVRLIKPETKERILFCSDDLHPSDLIKEGHINRIVTKAISLGVDPITAIRIASYNAAQYFQLTDVGAIAPGYFADIILFKDMKVIKPDMVIRSGEIVVEKGVCTKKRKINRNPPRGTVNIGKFSIDKLKIFAPVGKKEARIYVIRIVPGELITKKETEIMHVSDGLLNSDTKRDILKLSVVERHRASGKVGLGFVSGMGLKYGALASTVAHDSHNIITVGTNDSDMYLAIQALVDSQGGKVVVKDGKVIELLPLPIAGLMSPLPIQKVSSQIKRLNAAAQKLGSRLIDPFMTLSFLALPVIPELKLTDFGLIDVGKFQVISLFAD